MTETRQSRECEAGEGADMGAGGESSQLAPPRDEAPAALLLLPETSGTKAPRHEPSPSSFLRASRRQGKRLSLPSFLPATPLTRADELLLVALQFPATLLALVSRAFLSFRLVLPSQLREAHQDF